MEQPLVSVLCINYNQAPYIKECLQSVWWQQYPNVEVLVADDCSTDHSVVLLQRLQQQYADTPRAFYLHLNQHNQGNCATFNTLLARAKGKYIVDLSTDDLLLPHRLRVQVPYFEQLPQHFGAIWSNALRINATGKAFALSYSTDWHVNRKTKGDLRAALLGPDFMATPTLLYRTEMLKKLGGFNASYSYEDYDIWERSSRNWHYAYQPDVLTAIRVVPKSLGKQLFASKRSVIMATTIAVFEQALAGELTTAEAEALAKNILYHAGVAAYQGLKSEFAELCKQLNQLHTRPSATAKLALHLPTRHLYLFWQWLRSKRERLFPKVPVPEELQQKWQTYRKRLQALVVKP